MEDLFRLDRPSSIPQPLLEGSGRTVFTPHLGSAVAEVRLAIQRAAAANIIDAVRGRPPGDAVTGIPESK